MFQHFTRAQKAGCCAPLPRLPFVAWFVRWGAGDKGVHLDRRAGAVQLNGQGPGGALAGVFGHLRLGGLAVGCLKLQVGAHLRVAQQDFVSYIVARKQVSWMLDGKRAAFGARRLRAHDRRGMGELWLPFHVRKHEILA